MVEQNTHRKASIQKPKWVILVKKITYEKIPNNIRPKRF